MDNQEIQIACEGSTNVVLDELKELHNFKERTREHYAKFKESVLQLGFSFPIFFWEDKDGAKFIIDAHGRKQFLMEMRTEGYKVPPLPAVRIFAKNKVEAKKKLLAHESRYGKIQEEPFYEFMNEEGFEISDDDVSSFTEIWEFDMEYNNTPQKDEEDVDTHTQTKPKCEACEEYIKAYHSAGHQPVVTQ